MGLLLLAALGLLVMGGKSASASPAAPGKPQAEAFEEDAPGRQTPVLPADEVSRRRAVMKSALATTEKTATKKTAVAKKKLAATKQTQVSRKKKLAPGGFYTIRNAKKGGTLEAVANLFKVSLAAIQAANPALNVVTTYKAGTKVRIP